MPYDQLPAELQDAGLNDYQIKVLISPEKTDISFKVSNGLNDEQAQAIAKLLQKNNYLVELDLSHNNLASPQTMEEIVKIPNLNQLNLDGTDFGSDAECFKSLAKNQKIKKLSLGAQPIDDRAIELLAASNLDELSIINGRLSALAKKHLINNAKFKITFPGPSSTQANLFSAHAPIQSREKSNPSSKKSGAVAGSKR